MTITADHLDTEKLKRHPASSAWPDLSDDAYLLLCNSIIDVGLQEPILIAGDLVVDGWHRLRACRSTGMDPKFEEMEDPTPERIAQVVIGKHQARRHLTKKELADGAVATMKACGMEYAEPGDRRQTAQNEPSAPAKITRQSVAETAGVSDATARRAIAEAKDGGPDRAKGIKDRATAAGGRSKRKRQEQLDGATAKRDAKEREDLLAEELDEARAFIVTLKARLGDVDGDDAQAEMQAVIADQKTTIGELRKELTATHDRLDESLADRDHWKAYATKMEEGLANV